MLSEITDWLRAQIIEGWPMLWHRPTLPLAIGIVGALCGGYAVSFWDARLLSTAHEERDLYSRCLETGSFTPQCVEIAKNAPKPAPIIKYVDRQTPDPEQAREIAALKEKLAAVESALEKAGIPKKERVVTSNAGIVADGSQAHPFHNASECPPHSMIIADNKGYGGRTMLSAPANMKGLCYVGNEAHDMSGPEVELRDPGK